MLSWKKEGKTAVLTMSNGENRMNLDFAQKMNTTLDEILQDGEVKSLVLTSDDEKNFSQGVHVQWMMERFGQKDIQSIKDFMNTMNEVFKKILLYPVPVIAAINGHAFGNGAIIACACDFRFMKSDRGFFCFPEVNVGIPFLPGMIAWVRKAVPEHKFQEWKYTGRRVTASELEESHVIIKASADLAGLMKDSMEFAASFDKKRGIFGEMKKRMNRHIIEIIEKEDPHYIESLFILVTD